MNFASLSDIITIGKPCSLKIFSKNIFAISDAVTIVVIDIKCTLFDNLSTNTTIVSYPDLVIGSWTIKSMVIYSHLYSGIASDCSNPESCWLLHLLC